MENHNVKARVEASVPYANGQRFDLLCANYQFGDQPGKMVS